MAREVPSIISSSFVRLWLLVIELHQEEITFRQNYMVAVTLNLDRTHKGYPELTNVTLKLFGCSSGASCAACSSAIFLVRITQHFFRKPQPPPPRPIPADTKALWPRLLDPSIRSPQPSMRVKIAVFSFLYCRVEVISNGVRGGAACDGGGARTPCYLIRWWHHHSFGGCCVGGDGGVHVSPI